MFLRNLSRGLLGGYSRGIRLRSNWGDLDAGAVRRELARLLGDELKKFRRERF